MHVHVMCPEGEVKFWLDPKVALARNYGVPARKIKELQKIVEEKRDEIAGAWKKHFRSSPGR